MTQASLTAPLPPGAAASSPSFARRAAEIAGLVAVWMALGFALRLDAEAYLVAGIPLAIAFQRFVAGAPLRAAWVREAPRLRLDRVTLGIALAASCGPLLMVHGAPLSPSRVAWAIAGVLGALGVGYAARNASRPARLASSSLAAALPGIPLTVLAALAAHAASGKPWPSLPSAAETFAVSLAAYVPICFALEEVVFRGVLDAHLARPADGARRRWGSAILVSALWGLWHLPVVTRGIHGAASIVAVGALLLFVHVIVGLGLTRAFRRTGTLLVPAIAHALLDATRNALLGG